MEVLRTADPLVVPPELLVGLSECQRENLLAHCQTLQENGPTHQNKFVNRRRGGHQQRSNNRGFRPHVPPPGVPRNPGLYKTTLCDFWIAGEPCRFEERCWYAHGPQELRQGSSNNFMPPPPHRQNNRRSFLRNNNGSMTAEDHAGGNVIVDPALQASRNQVRHPWASPQSQQAFSRVDIDKLFESANSVFKFDVPYPDPSVKAHALGSIESGFEHFGSSSTWTNSSSTPSRPSWMTPSPRSVFDRNETGDLFESPPPAVKNDMSAYFAIPEPAKLRSLGTIGSERRRGSQTSTSTDSSESISDRQRMLSEVQLFRSIMREAENAAKKPQHDPLMDGFLSIFQSTTIDAPFEDRSSESSTSPPVVPKIGFSSTDCAFFDEDELWHSVGLHTAQL